MGSLTRFNLRHILSLSAIETLVETGTGRGNSLVWAVEAGLRTLYSVEQEAALFAHCVQRFADHPQVHLHQGHFVAFLTDIAAKQLPCGFYFLDAHLTGGADFGMAPYADPAAREDSYSLLDVLAVLLKTDLSRSIIVIDDARMYFDGAFQAGVCPEFARRWQDRAALAERLRPLEATHAIHLLRHDEGYLVIVPKTLAFDQHRWLMVRAQDSSGPVAFLPNVPGVTGISIQRRLADSRFATRYFRGHGIDIGGSPDSLAAYKELFPLIQNVFVYDQPYGDGQILDNVPDAMFDFLYSSHCLEHLRDPREALMNWIRVVKPEGHLVVTVPDEDLYEQGIWPSRLNSDHKISFTIAKSNSWSPVSVNVLDLLGEFREQVDILSLTRIDHGYREKSLPRTIDQTRTPLAECAIEFVLRKKKDVTDQISS